MKLDSVSKEHLPACLGDGQTVICPEGKKFAVCNIYMKLTKS
jgi:hypothetical protein